MTDCAFRVDKEAICDICHHNGDIEDSTFTNLNHLISQIIFCVSFLVLWWALPHGCDRVPEQPGALPSHLLGLLCSIISAEKAYCEQQSMAEFNNAWVNLPT